MSYVRSKDFRYTMVAIVVFFMICLMVAFIWLKAYTHHGQRLELPDYVGFHFDEAQRDAKKARFRMSIQDSVHLLGKPGGLIIKQNPSPGSMVKQNRMIYVTITKRSPDKISSNRLPEMYGKSYERKKRELVEHFEIQSRIADTRYDPGEPGQILEVRYKGEVVLDANGRNNDIQIEKGDFLEFVISAKTGGRVEVPDLFCKSYEEVVFLLENLGLEVGTVKKSGPVEVLEAAFILEQFPASDGGMIDMGSRIDITVVAEKPVTCL